MPTFPTLTMEPSVDFEEEYEENRITSKFENGSQHVRARYTKSRRKFTVRYNYLPTVDKVDLTDFWVDDLEYGVLSFSWTHPISAIVYTVRFDAPLKFTYLIDTDGGYWKTELILQEV